MDNRNARPVDITPTPRILRTLGDIPFFPWQCLAELIDNCVDAFSEADRANLPIPDKEVVVKWSRDSVAARDRTIEIIDNGPGMTLEQLQNAARAGYTSNDPINNLGLFGMGFNIATARLGERTVFLSATEDATEWVGLEIDFPSLIKSGSFAAPVIREPKQTPSESGTRIVISNLRGETYTQLRDQESTLRRQLERVYTPLLSDSEIKIFVQGKQLSPRPHCVWGRTRFVNRDRERIPAIIDIDRNLGEAFFDIEKNAYIYGDLQDDLEALEKSGGALPSNIIKRQKRLHGWIGIQRYSDPNDFGLDFVRNGRKILIQDKSLFQFENPFTGTAKLEYPIELGSTVGGRIVGELNVDYLIPTYQKNSFDRTDSSWKETIEALRGIGPILPRDRKEFLSSTDPNDSPLGRLVNAYRRADPGSKNLAVDRTKAKQYTEAFRRGDPNFQNDDKWWELVLEADKEAANKNAGAASDVDSGVEPSDDLDSYGPPTTPSPAPKPKESTKVDVSTSVDELKQQSALISLLSGPYGYGVGTAIKVRCFEMVTGTHILHKGEKVPSVMFFDGVDGEYFYNPRHAVFTQYPITPKEMLSVHLAERFNGRDAQKNVGMVFAKLIQSNMKEARIDKAGLQEKASAVFDAIRERISNLLAHRAKDVLECVHESSGDAEETVSAMLDNVELLHGFQQMDPVAIDALRYVPNKALLRLIDRFAEDLFDSKLFRAPLQSIRLGDNKATERARTESKERIQAFLKDAAWISNGSASSRSKEELARCSHSISFLETELGL
jgi:hypothetical protein